MSKNNEILAKGDKKKEKLKITDVIALLLIISCVGLSLFYVFTITNLDGKIERNEDTIESLDQFWEMIISEDFSVENEFFRLDREVNQKVESGLMNETLANITIDGVIYQHWIEMFSYIVRIYTYDLDSLEELSPGITDEIFRGDEPMIEFVFIGDSDNAHWLYENFTNVNISIYPYSWYTWEYEHSQALIEDHFYEIAFDAAFYPQRFNNYKNLYLTEPLRKFYNQKDILLISIEANTLAIVIMGFALDVHKWVKYISIFLAVIFLLGSVFYANPFGLTDIFAP